MRLIQPSVSTMRAGNLVQDRDSRKVSVGGEPISLTTQEFEILALLVERKSSIVPLDDLCIAIWGESGPREAKRLTVIISRLRELLHRSYPFVIETVRSRGYGLVARVRADRH
jgi:two-component system OmpR family response regulator